METDILHLAKQGDAEAIAALMNHSLAAVGITIQAEVQAGCLIISAVSTSTAPNRHFLLDRIYQGLQKLQPAGIRKAIIRGYVWHASTPDWIDGFDLSYHTHQKQQSVWAQQRRSRSKKPLAVHRTEPLSRLASSLQNRWRWFWLGSPKPSPSSTEVFAKNPPQRSQIYREIQFFLAIVFFCLRLGMYLLAISGLIFFTFEMKYQASWFVEKHIYTIPAVGDFLRGIEMIEIGNIFIFAILGMGIGIATILLPRGFLSGKLSLFLVTMAVPLVFLASPIVKYEFWIDNLAVEETISAQEAKKITNSFLQQRVEAEGVWGFYLYSAQFPVIPTRVERLQEVEQLKAQITRKVANITQLEIAQVSLLFKICSWGIRGFYAVLALIVAWFHFFKGLETIRWQRRSSS